MPKMIGEYDYDNHHIRVWWFHKSQKNDFRVAIVWDSAHTPQKAWFTVEEIRDEASDGYADWPQLLAVVESFIGGGIKWVKLRSRVRAYQSSLKLRQAGQKQMRNE